MPTYVYQCKACEHQFETIQKMTDDPIKICPECKGEVARILFPPGIVFKGSGFHINDYPSAASSAYKASKKLDTPSEPKAETKTETKTETKPETKTETAAATS